MVDLNAEVLIRFANTKFKFSVEARKWRDVKLFRRPQKEHRLSIGIFLEALPCLSLLKAKKDTELELLATVDYIVYSKLKSGETPTEQSVFQYISNSPVWSQKITRLSLTEQMVADCMTFLRELSKQGLPYPKHS